MKKRSLKEEIELLALDRGKMAFVSGPRQVGKTTLAKMLIKNGDGHYYNWDDLDFRRMWTKSPKGVVKDLSTHSTVIFDEIHKASKWKQNIKGVYDTLDRDLRILVTGSARLDLYKKGADSLMGRYLGFRLHPFSLGEMTSRKLPLTSDFIGQISSDLSLSNSSQIQDNWEQLKIFGGFPEPLFSSSKRVLNIWQRGRIEKIVREDLRDLSRIPELSKIEMLISLLPERVGSPLSLQSLREELEISYDTAKRWMGYLKSLYYHFEIRPWSKNISRSLKKEGKLYLWDWSEVKEEGPRFENMVASHLLKACHYWTDTGEGKFDLHYLKTKDKKEIDFLVTKDGVPWIPIECKLNSTNLSPNFESFIPIVNAGIFFQLIDKPNYLKKMVVNGKKVFILSAGQFFRFLP